MMKRFNDKSDSNNTHSSMAPATAAVAAQEPPPNSSTTFPAKAAPGSVVLSPFTTPTGPPSYATFMGLSAAAAAIASPAGEAAVGLQPVGLGGFCVGLCFEVLAFSWRVLVRRFSLSLSLSFSSTPSLCVSFLYPGVSSSLAVSLPPFLFTTRPRCLSYVSEPLSAADPPPPRYTQGSRQSSISNAGSASGYSLARDSFLGSPSLSSSVQKRGRQLLNAESDEDARRSSNLRKRLERSASPYTKRGGMSLVRRERISCTAYGWLAWMPPCFWS